MRGDCDKVVEWTANQATRAPYTKVLNRDLEVLEESEMSLYNARRLSASDDKFPQMYFVKIGL